MAGRFEGKQALVLGVANQRSIAWAIAKRLADEGATVAFTFQGERIEKNVRDLADSVSSPLVTECDVRSDEDVARVFADVAEAFGGGLDVLVHSVAFAAAEDLEGRFVDTPRDRFWMAVDISAYSLVACARAAEPLMEARGGGSIVTMTYLGGERAVPHYNVMGVAKATLDASVRYLAWDLGFKNIRVNAISAGPVRTLAARSIAGFTTMQTMFEERAPLHRPIDSDDCGGAAAYLLSDDAANVSGTTLYVDAGYHAMGMQVRPGSIEQRLRELDLELPEVSAPAASYVNAVRTGSLVFLSGAGPRSPEGELMTGKVGADVTTEDAAAHARLVGLGLLAVLRDELGDLDRVRRIVKLFGMVNAVPEFTEHSTVVNGCSDLFIEIFGEGHARSAVGVGSLPLGLSVEIEAIVEVE